MQVRDIVCLKVTGEKVYLIAETDRHTWTVRRPHVADNGSIVHEVEEFFDAELESLEDYAKRIVNEMKLKQRSQKELYKDEMAIAAAAEEEMAMGLPTKNEPDPIN